LPAAFNTGQSGLATIHADNALAGLRKLESLIGAHDGIAREQIAAAIGVVIFIEQEDRLPAGRKVREVIVVQGFNQERLDYNLRTV
jgi:type IV secretion system protein VirB11